VDLRLSSQPASGLVAVALVDAAGPHDIPALPAAVRIVDEPTARVLESLALMVCCAARRDGREPHLDLGALIDLPERLARPGH
jgi:hypothetical protein